MAKNDLHTLIRLRKWEVDEKRRALGTLMRQEEAVLDMRALEAEIVAERAFAGKAIPDHRRTLGAYLEHAGQRRDKLLEALAEVRRQIELVRDDLGEFFRRLKTFEVTQEQRDVAQEKEDNRLEQIDLDEMGLTLHRRKTSSEAV